MAVESTRTLSVVRREAEFPVGTDGRSRPWRHAADNPAACTTPRPGNWPLLLRAHRLCGQVYATRSAPLRAWRQLRWYLLLATHPVLGLRWLRTLEQPPLRDYAAAHPPLLLKPLRPYVSSRWDVRQRCKVIVDSHHALGTMPQLRRALLTSSGVRLVHGALSGGTPFEIRLCRDQQFRKEGELVLALHDSWQGKPLFTLTLAFEYGSGQSLRCYIGNVQGRGQSCESIKAVSKACHGMRPPALLLHVARGIAARVGATVLLGASNAIQVHGRKHLIHIPRLHRLQYDYDRLWQELGGWLDSDGWYRLPLQAARRERDSIPSRKRAQYERRYEWLQNLDTELLETLQVPAGH